MTTIYSDSEKNVMTATPAYPLVKLYAHVDIPDGALRGQVVTQGNFPDQTVALKAKYGMYPWQIGTDCMSRTFHTVKAVGGSISRGEPLKGCPACRANPSEEMKKDISEADSLRKRIAELEAKLQDKSEAQAKPEFYQCNECEHESKSERGLKIHSTIMHKKEVK